MENDGRKQQRKVGRRIPSINGEATSTLAREILDHDHAKK